MRLISKNLLSRNFGKLNSKSNVKEVFKIVHRQNLKNFKTFKKLFLIFFCENVKYLK